MLLEWNDKKLHGRSSWHLLYEENFKQAIIVPLQETNLLMNFLKFTFTNLYSCFYIFCLCRSVSHLFLLVLCEIHVTPLSTNLPHSTFTIVIIKTFFLLGDCCPSVTVCLTGQCQSTNALALTVTVTVEYGIKTNYVCLWVSCWGWG